MSKNISYLNSTSILLSADETFTGIPENVSTFSSISITINSNISSAENGLKIYMGPTIDNLINKNNYTYIYNENTNITIKLTDIYFKIEYINSDINQTSFYIQTFLSNNALPSTNNESVSVSSTRKSNRNGSTSNLQNNGNIVATTGTSTQLNVSNYGTNCIWSYEDSLITSLEPVILYGFAPSSGLYSQPIAKISPTPISGVAKRIGYCFVDLSPFLYVQIINKSSITFTEVFSTIMSG
jgi:hypothetical protein